MSSEVDYAHYFEFLAPSALCLDAFNFRARHLAEGAKEPKAAAASLKLSVEEAIEIKTSQLKVRACKLRRFSRRVR